MKINKFGAAVGILIVAVLAVFVFNIDIDTMCTPPRVSTTVSDDWSTMVIRSESGYAVCAWINPPTEPIELELPTYEEIGGTLNASDEVVLEPRDNDKNG